MIVTEDEIVQTYMHKIKEPNLQIESSVLVFVAPEADAIAAAHIFTNILKSDGVMYKMVPVSNYNDIEYHLHNVSESQHITVVMLNCGGIYNLTHIELNDEQSLHIIDAHRPYHWKNIYEEKNIIIWDVDKDYRQFIPSLSDINADQLPDSIEVEDTEDQDDSDSDLSDWDSDDYESGDDANDPSSMDLEPESMENDNNDLASGPRRRQQSFSQLAGVPQPSMSVKQQFKQQLKEYAKLGTFFGTAAAIVVFHLAEQSNTASQSAVDKLWWALIGLTEQYVFDRIDITRYELLVEEFGKEVQKMNSVPNNIRTDDGYTIPIAHRNITPQNDYRFILYRHWTLYESMIHTASVCGVMQLWKQRGRDTLHQMLSKMGIPLDHIQQNFVDMPNRSRENFGDRIQRYGPQFGLDHVFFKSFMRQYGYTFQISAADLVHAITALFSSSASMPGTRSGDGDNNEEERDEEDKEQKDSDYRTWEHNFLRAFDALSGKEVRLMRQGIQEAIALRKSIVYTATSMFENKLILPSGPFRYAFLHDGAELSAFAHPLTVTALAMFVVEIINYQQPGRPKPFVLGVRNEASDTYLIVGVAGQTSHHVSSLIYNKNKFGVAFKKAARKTASRVRHDGFDASVIEVAKADYKKFMEYLHFDIV
eukprot:gb/GECH01009590.1/.p1 GENE.gb/GECH01009590.1/~~gb/GECH01009590.1/.p1  ORF type:complete len:649 (+),score=157.17 gb/GECH01009590.1/:1-1947(+)